MGSKDTEKHLDEEDLKRAEKGTELEDPLRSTVDEVHVPDTELKNSSEAAKKSSEKNDPTSDRSATS